MLDMKESGVSLISFEQYTTENAIHIFSQKVVCSKNRFEEILQSSSSQEKYKRCILLHDYMWVLFAPRDAKYCQYLAKRGL